MKKNILKNLPSVNKVLLYVQQRTTLHEDYLKYLINSELTLMRSKIVENKIQQDKEEIFSYIANRILSSTSKKLTNLINGTGIVLHTGFGRAPFQASTLINLAKRMEGYVNLEFNLENGKRGDRQNHVRDYINALCECESSLIVNNNAAAVMLAINELGQNGEVIVSRGQLVEIGGSFRIPDIINKSGCILKEVGTTNRTHDNDYVSAITNKTKLILWVHTSNYVIKGFTHAVSLKKLVTIGKKYKIPVMVDWGSGSLLDMRNLNVANEKKIREIMKVQPDILTFSGDKLIGGPQSGLIIGKQEIITSLQRNPIYRTIRCDKITIGLMEETLRNYKAESFSKDNLSLTLLTTSRKKLLNRGKKILLNQTKRKIADLGIELIESYVEAGSGSLPEKKIESAAIVFNPKSVKIEDLAKNLRCGSTPVVGYISGNKLYIDLKAVLPNQISSLSQAIERL